MIMVVMMPEIEPMPGMMRGVIMSVTVGMPVPACVGCLMVAVTVIVRSRRSYSVRALALRVARSHS
jgi:hypothetical protein